mmetsp:Transcript_25896/g.42780  ORF Transcript_25896/g.42780 Transcript_25896/m.42780 type:complete len:113 (+) Transcript_25896:247-585(+)
MKFISCTLFAQRTALIREVCITLTCSSGPPSWQGAAGASAHFRRDANFFRNSLSARLIPASGAAAARALLHKVPVAVPRAAHHELTPTLTPLAAWLLGVATGAGAALREAIR